MRENDPATICGEALPYPVPTCTRPNGHEGPHTTEMIPEPLAAVVANTIQTLDALQREHGDIVSLRERTQRIYRVLWIGVALNAGLAVFLISAQY